MNLTVMTLNIHKGKHPLRAKETLTALRDFIALHQADLVFLQEVIGSDPGELTVDQTAFLAQGLNSQFCYGKNVVVEDYHHGNAILSRHPITHWSNTDLSTNRFERRGLLEATVDIPGKGLVRAYCAHLNLLRGGRRDQLRKIAELMDNDSRGFGGPLFFCGDFNDWSKDANEPFYARKWKEVGVESEERHFLTFPSWWPRMALDRIYFKSARLIEAEALPFGKFGNLSDHLPILARFDIDSGNEDALSGVVG